MMYAIKFYRRAKEELQRAKQVYGQRFSSELDEWLNELAISASKNQSLFSLDFLEFIEAALESKDNFNNWHRSFLKWQESGIVDKLKAILVIIRTGKPPFEMRYTFRHFHGVLDVFDCQIEVHYRIDHVSKEIVFVKFSGLPGEGD